MRMRARLWASVSSDSVTISREPPASPGGLEAQPPRASSSVAPIPAQARALLGSRNPGAIVVMSSCLLRAGRQDRHLFQHHGALLGDAFAHAGAILDVAGQLAAGGVYVVTSCFTHSGDDTSITQDFCEGQHLFVGRTRQARLRKRVERNQIEL